MSLRAVIAAAVARHRSARGWSQRDLASRAQVSLDTVARIEAPDGSDRARTPSVGVLERLAGALNVDPVELVQGDEARAIDAGLLARQLLAAVPLPEALRRLSEAALDGVPSIVRK